MMFGNTKLAGRLHRNEQVSLVVRVQIMQFDHVKFVCRLLIVKLGMFNEVFKFPLFSPWSKKDQLTGITDFDLNSCDHEIIACQPFPTA